MAEKVYEMYEEYSKRAAYLLKMIEARDLLIKSIKNTPVHQRAAKQSALNEANQNIESFESDLAEEYEAYQEKCRIDEYVKTVDRFLEKVFIQTKYCLPEKFEELKTALFNVMTEEQIIDFEDRIAILEATRLDDFIGENAEIGVIEVSEDNET